MVDRRTRTWQRGREKQWSPRALESERVTESWECDKACTSKAKGKKRGERIKMRYRRHEGMGGQRRRGDEARWQERKNGG